MNTRRYRGARAALVSLEADAASARGGFACMFSTADEYESALISERRAQGRYGRSYSPWPLALFGGCTLVALGAVLGGMNVCFYLAIDRLPLATVGAIEFLGPIALAWAGLHSRRNGVALAVAAAGVAMLTHVRFAGTAAGFAFAFANCALFMLYIVLGHRIARDGGGNGIDRLAAAMLVALLVVMPLGWREAAVAFSHPGLLAAGIGVGVSSSVIPYVCDQLAMARLPRATFALMLALLPATACVIGIVVLHQWPGPAELTGIALVIAGINLHRVAPR